MKKNIFIEKLIQKPIEQQEIEIVERKGIGHPDSISDGIAESVSRALCNAYIEQFGEIMHHNTDEVQITAGESDPVFGGGDIIKPMDILLTGRGIAEFHNEKNGKLEIKKMGLDRIAIAAAKEYLRENIINLDVETATVVECKIGHGSGDLTDVFKRKGEAPSSNDTSFGVGYAPFSETENIVLATENLLNSLDFKKKYPQVGEDIKVMGLRDDNHIVLTVASAMVSKYVNDLDHYIDVKAKVHDEVQKLAEKYTERNVEVYINTADVHDPENPSVYLTVTGTSAEMGDDGSVGRGNRANGLITPNRPMSMEATSGKNPINHVGKIYNLLSNKIANNITEEVEGVKQVHIMLLSQIGKPINLPKAASVQMILENGYQIENVNKQVEEVTDYWLENITSITDMLVAGKIRTF
ncbi:MULTISPECIES: methionine adenosyltransferase [Methanobacterium]|uniref:S-adenosylmethionine synthase n=1 Tax=Methanobacterium bryantii TaxID=2161 RepID=A0A2A2H178_METBR|nr:MULTISPECIES: methionine adenosyltransferase [Methanobacterium]OEC86559.1 S-adenosylmethionine synthetase [Methanobacterium sp. A39]PAV03080.1 S-adenosylmethionine synthetase [Methanobacterium bryantii]